MKGDELLLWILLALLAAAIAVTLIWAPQKSRHGYGEALPAGRGVGSVSQPAGTNSSRT